MFKSMTDETKKDMINFFHDQHEIPHPIVYNLNFSVNIIQERNMKDLLAAKLFISDVF